MRGAPYLCPLLDLDTGRSQSSQIHINTEPLDDDIQPDTTRLGNILRNVQSDLMYVYIISLLLSV